MGLYKEENNYLAGNWNTTTEKDWVQNIKVWKRREKKKKDMQENDLLSTGVLSDTS